MKNKIDIDGMIEAVEVLKDAQIELDEVITKIREAVRGTPVEGTFKAYTLPSLSMIAHEEDHEYMGREGGNLDALMRELNEITEEQIALVEERASEKIEREDIGDAELAHLEETEDQDPGGYSEADNPSNGWEVPEGLKIDESKQVKLHDQPDRVRDVLTVLSVEQLVILRRATRGFDGHPGVDSSTIVYYKPEFLAVALIGWVEDHVKQVVDQGMSSRDLTITLEILEKFHRAGFSGVNQEDLSHVEMERDEERGREAVISGGGAV